MVWGVVWGGCGSVILASLDLSKTHGLRQEVVGHVLVRISGWRMEWICFEPIGFCKSTVMI